MKNCKKWLDPKETLPDEGEVVLIDTGHDVIIGGRVYDSDGWLWGQCFSFWWNGEKYDGDIELDDDYRCYRWTLLLKPIRQGVS